MLHSICQQIWKAQQWPQDWKRSVFIPIPKGNAKECSNYCTSAFISHTSQVVLKILQARLQQYMKCEFPDVQARFRKGRGTRDQIANICALHMCQHIQHCKDIKPVSPKENRSWIFTGRADAEAEILIEKARVLEKHLLLFHWLHQSLWLCGSQQTVEHS